MASTRCERFGPGRLPYAQRRGVGGAITMAANGLLVALMWFGVVGWLLLSGHAGTDLAFFFGFGLFFLPAAAITSVVVGYLLWGLAYDASKPRTCGAVFGALTAFSSLVAGALFLGLIISVSNAHRGTMGMIEAFGVGFVIVSPFAILFALVAVGWILVPVFAVGGWYHEHATNG